MLRPPASSSLALLVVSFVTLVYELVQVRVFAFSLHPLIAYSAIALAMLGFGLGSLTVALRPAWFSGGPLRVIGGISLLLAAAILVATFVFARTSPFVFPVELLAVDPIATAVALLPCVVPYALTGMLITVILESRIHDVGRAYFWNLAGSALGCVVVPWAMRSIGAERVMFLCASSAALVPVLLGPAPRWIRASAGILSASAIVCTPWAPALLRFQPDPSDLVYLLAARSGSRVQAELSVWDPVGRIDVLRHADPIAYVEEPVEFRTITNDSGAMSLMLRQPSEPGTWGRAIFEESLYGLAYRVSPPDTVLVVGVGGGTDIHAALHWNARRVVGVDVSLATLDAVRGPYADFAGWPKDPRVTLIHEDGRSFTRRTKDRFDLVQLTGVDTFTMHSASAMVTAEDVLYTEEAFAQFIGVLEPGGMLAVTRYGDEAMNLSAIAVAALRRLGAPRPDQHIAAVQQANASGILVKRTPFTSGEIDRLRGIERRQQPTALRIAHYDDSGLRGADPIRLLHPPGRAPDPRYAQYFDAVANHQEPRVLHAGGVPFVVPTDDRPYYMLGQWTIAGGANHPIIAAVKTTMLTIGTASVALLVLPLLSARKGAAVSLARVVTVVVYFAAIGAAFMLLEVGLIRRTIVFVGSPGAAVSVVIASILSGASVGAGMSDRMAHRPALSVVLPAAALGAIGMVFHTVSAPLFDWLFGLPMGARSLSAALALLPGAFFAGWFFPRGMAILARTQPSLAAWAVGVNAFASVLASLATLALGVAFGFQTIFAVGLGLYGLACLVILPATREI